MKRCPQCNRVEAEDTLTFCRVDGTPLVREASVDAGTLKFGSALVTGEAETRVLPTGEAAGRTTAPTTVLDGQRAGGGTRELGKPKSHKGVLITAAVAIAVVLAASAYLFLSRDGGSAKNSIAVLPFQNASDDPDVEYLSDGISESLINSLSQLPNVRVLARSTMFRFKGQDADPQAVGKQLGVEAVLTGRLVQRGDGLVVQTDLVNVSDGTQLWGERYNRKLTDVQAVQEEIVRDVSAKLGARLSGVAQLNAARSYTAKPEAYRLYLLGRFHWNKRRVPDLRISIDYFQQAIAADPNYALAYAGLADAYALLSEYGGAAPREAIPKAREAALKALSLDDQLADAHAALGLVLVDDYNFAGAEREYKRAIELNPNDATARQRYGYLLTYFARHEEGLAEVRRALETDPLSLIINRSYGDNLLYARRYDEGIAQLEKTISLDANFASAHTSLGNAYWMKAEYAASVEEYAKYQEVTGRQQHAALMRESFSKGGWEGFLRMRIEDLRTSDTPYEIALYRAALGEKDKAFAELNRSYENREWGTVLLKVDPRLDPLRSDPRFAELLHRVGLPQ